MRGKLVTVATVGIAVLGACTVTAPITGQFDNGEPISGMATGSLGGGTVMVQSQAGQSCEGEYNPFSEARELTIQLVCDDGRTGVAQVTRNEDLVSGEGKFELSDGRAGTFTFAAD